jgi:hypothetical protein
MKIISFFLFLFFLSVPSFGSEKVILDGQNLFPLVHWGEIDIREALDKQPKTRKIPLGFCNAHIVQDDLTRLTGRSLDGKNWELDLSSPGIYEGGIISIYLGDLDQNGLTDIILEYSYPTVGGVTASGDSHLLFILFDKTGWPHPQEFYVHLQNGGQPFTNILRDSQGKAVLVHKRLVRNGEELNMFCYASFYRAVNTKWEKLPVNNLTVQNPTNYSSFNLNSEKKPFDDSDQALELCSGKEEDNAPDFGSFQVTKFKKIKSFEEDETTYWPSFQVIAEDNEGRDRKIKVPQCEICYVVIEQETGVKIINMEGTDVKKEVLKMVKEAYPMQLIKVKNNPSYFIYFSRGAGRTFR